MRTLMIEFHRFDGIGLAGPNLFFDGIRLGCVTIYWSRERVSQRLEMMRARLSKVLGV